MGKNLLLKAENQLLKADKLFQARQFKKAAKYYHVSGNTYLTLGEHEKAKSSFIYAANAYIEIDKYLTGLDVLRLAGDACLYNENYLEANEIYRKSEEFIPKLKKAQDRNYYYIQFSVLSYLCLFTKAKQQDGLNFIKKIQKRIDNTYFKEHPLIILVTELTICLRDKNPNYIEKIKNNFSQYKLNEVELELLKEILFILDLHFSLTSELHLDKEIYTTNQIINFKVNIDTTSTLPVIQNPFYNQEIDILEITKINLSLSDNLSSSKKPLVPIDFQFGNNYELHFVIKPHFQLDNPFIGPLSLTCELKNKLIFIYETENIIPRLISPPPTLEISTKNLRPPLIDQTFPLEILVQNRSDGEALDVIIEAEFPEQLKIMRGTTTKQIYSLRTNEEIKWEINLKPLEAGDYTLTISIRFKDPDQNIIEEIKQFPISIKL